MSIFLDKRPSHTCLKGGKCAIFLGFVKKKLSDHLFRPITMALCFHCFKTRPKRGWVETSKASVNDAAYLSLNPTRSISIHIVQSTYLPYLAK